MSWKNEKFYTTASEIKDYLNLSDEEEKQMEVILERFPMSVPEYYLSLIDKNDPADPIRRMCIRPLQKLIFPVISTPAAKPTTLFRQDFSTSIHRLLWSFPRTAAPCTADTVSARDS